MTRFLAIAASHRPDSYNLQLLSLWKRHLPESVDCELLPYASLDMPHYNDCDRLAGMVPPAASALKETLSTVSGLVIATPEYNWSYPGSLKNILDWLSHFSPNPFAGKSALLMSATPSKRGGVLAMQQLKIPLDSLDMHVYPGVFALGEAHQAFTESGTLISEKKTARLRQLTDDFLRFSDALMS